MALRTSSWVKRPVGSRLGQLLDEPGPNRLLERGGEPRRFEPGGFGKHAQLEARPGDGCQLEQPARLGGQTREALPHELADPLGASQLVQRPGQAQSAVALLDRAALAQVAPELAEEERRPAGELAERGGELRTRLRFAGGADERTHLLGAETAEGKPRTGVEARQVGKRVGETSVELLAAVAVGGYDEQPRLRSRAREPAQQLQRLAV